MHLYWSATSQPRGKHMWDNAHNQIKSSPTLTMFPTLPWEKKMDNFICTVSAKMSLPPTWERRWISPDIYSLKCHFTPSVVTRTFKIGKIVYLIIYTLSHKCVPPRREVTLRGHLVDTFRGLLI
ncbi:uncharacterized protein LOC143242843 [Tachypleus tridentatus]|uniref:uncharacterized protein LOC143242795 n=1 Tax=Tachypleus tridentatus TaxID=6853 RepID=UPI003FD6210F